MLIDRAEYEGEGGVPGLFIGVCYLLKIYGAIAMAGVVLWAMWRVLA